MTLNDLNILKRLIILHEMCICTHIFYLLIPPLKQLGTIVFQGKLFSPNMKIIHDHYRSNKEIILKDDQILYEPHLHPNSTSSICKA